MNNETILTMLKQGLEIITDYMDEESKAAKNLELMQYVETAEVFIEREGIVLEDNVSDQMLVSMYAMWLYDKRKTTGSKYTSYYIQNMPRMLRYNLNNRLLQQKVRDDT
jgi:hypothetical protein